MDATRRLTQSRPQQPTAPQLADQTNLLGRSFPALSLITLPYGVHPEVICVIATAHGLAAGEPWGPSLIDAAPYSSSSPQSIRVLCSRASVRNDSRCVPRCIITGLYMYDVYEEQEMAISFQAFGSLQVGFRCG